MVAPAIVSLTLTIALKTQSPNGLTAFLRDKISKWQLHIFVDILKNHWITFYFLFCFVLLCEIVSLCCPGRPGTHFALLPPLSPKCRGLKVCTTTPGANYIYLSKDLFYTFACTSVYIIHLRLVLMESRRECWSLGTGLTGSSEIPWTCWELNSESLKEQEVPLITEPYLSPKELHNITDWDFYHM